MKCPRCGSKMKWHEHYIALDGKWQCPNKKCDTIYQQRLDNVLSKFDKEWKDIRWPEYVDYNIARITGASMGYIRYDLAEETFTLFDSVRDIDWCEISLNTVESLLKDLEAEE